MTLSYADSLSEVESIAAGDRQAAPSVTTTVRSGSQPRILMVDDDPFMLKTQSAVLQSMGYGMVGIAGNAAGALARLTKAPGLVDVIICDLHMPGMDGIEFLQKMRETSFCGGVILLSGEGTHMMHAVQKLLQGSRFQILGALEKPASRAELHALLETWKPFSVPTAAGPTMVFSGSDLHTAIHNRELVLHYQPRVDLRTTELVGMEALVRWQHPTYGLVFPDNFIGIAEECGAIDALSAWVFDEAFGQLALWHAGGMHIQMSVNVSMDNLRAPDFATQITALVQIAGIAQQDVTLEITESRLMSPLPMPLETLVRLRLQRFRLSIDDFGTGHSSLAQLRDVPFTELKIDRGFVSGARQNPLIRPMLDSSISIAKRLNMQSVAEGVETEDDWHLVRELECDFAQGYFIGRPMAKDKVSAWLAQWTERKSELLEQWR